MGVDLELSYASGSVMKAIVGAADQRAWDDSFKDMIAQALNDLEDDEDEHNGNSEYCHKEEECRYGAGGKLKIPLRRTRMTTRCVGQDDFQKDPCMTTGVLRGDKANSCKLHEEAALVA